MDSAAGRVLFPIGLCLLLGLFEIQFPAQGKQTLSGRVRNIILTVIGLALGAVATSVIYLLIPAEVRRLPNRGILFSIGVAFAYALLTDFLYYWYHRAQHTTRLLWAVHELHHSDAELNATTSMRTYWLEKPLQALCIGIPVGYIVGLDQGAAIIVSFALTGWFFFAHANWRLRLGFLNPLICGPQVHRIHHSNLPQHRDKNFAQFFPFIDVIFGTYYAPSANEFPPTGAPELPSDASLATLMMRPFRLWAALVRDVSQAEKLDPRCNARAPSGKRRTVGSRLRSLAGAGLIVLVTSIAYLPSLNGAFLIDDDMLLTDSPLIKATDGIYRFWCTTEPYDYWPLTNTTLWLEWRLWGMHSIGYHVTNLGVHLVDSLLIWTILQRLFVPGAFLAALLFAVHPVNVESVAWIAQRKNLLAMLFLLAAVLAYLKSEASSPRPARPSPPIADRWYWVALTAFVLAMLSKVSAAVLPLVLLCIVRWRRPLMWRDLARTAPFFLLAAVLMCVNLWFRMHTLEIPPPPGGFVERLLGGAGAVWFYLYKALLPLDLVFIYPRWHIQAGQLQCWLPLLAALVVTGVLWRYRQGWSHAPLFAWGYFCVALLPVMGFTEQLVVADHYQHVALIGVLALVAAGWARGQERARGSARRVLNAAAVTAVGALAVLASRQSALYSDNVTLLQAAVNRNPDSAVAQHLAGYALLKAGRLQEAREHLEEAVRIDPAYPEAHNTLGGALAQAGQLQDAVRHFEDALRLRPNYAGAHNNLGTVLRQTDRTQEAVEHLQQALRYRPDFPEAHCNLAKVLLQEGRTSEAIEHFRQALRFKPDFPEAQNLLDAARTDTGQVQEARRSL